MQKIYGSNNLYTEYRITSEYLDWLENHAINKKINNKTLKQFYHDPLYTKLFKK